MRYNLKLSWALLAGNRIYQNLLGLIKTSMLNNKLYLHISPSVALHFEQSWFWSFTENAVCKTLNMMVGGQSLKKKREIF